MSILTVARVEDQLQLTVNVDASTLEGASGLVSVRPREALFVSLLIQKSPAIVTHSLIESEILSPANLAEFDPLLYIRKLKLESTRALQKATGKDGIIRAVRGLGYGLHSTWIRHNSVTLSEAEKYASALASIASECITTIKATPFVLTQHETRVLTPNSPIGNAVLTRFKEWIRKLPSGAVEADLIASLESYINFQRSGNVDEETWRLLFERELRQLTTLAGLHIMAIAEYNQKHE